MKFDEIYLDEVRKYEYLPEEIIQKFVLGNIDVTEVKEDATEYDYTTKYALVITGNEDLPLIQQNGKDNQFRIYINGKIFVCSVKESTNRKLVLNNIYKEKVSSR